MANRSYKNNKRPTDDVEDSPRIKALAEAKAEAAKAKTELARARATEAKVRTAVLSKTHADGFMNFVREQGIVGLAVGLALGTAAGASVKTIVDQFISPIVALLTRGVDLNSLKWIITPAANGQKEVAIGYGTILSSIITLLATAFVIYLIVHLAKLDRIDKKKAS